MNIYLVFEKRDNIPLFDLEISQEEDSFATARAVVEAGILLPPGGTIGSIQGASLYFKGVLIGGPVKVDGPFAEIELIACPPDISEKIERLQQGMRHPPYWDALWVKEPDQGERIQDAHTSSLYCDRRTWDLARSDWFEGRQTLTLHDSFFPASLQLRMTKRPLKACTVKVHAHWVQKEEGVTDLSSAIRLSFPQSRVSTYTKESLLKKWPTPGHRVGRSGVWILKSDLKEMTPASSLYPSYSPAVPLREDGEDPKPYRVKRHWFKPTLWVSWQYHQKRKETLIVTLHHGFQDLYPGEGEHKVVEFTLQNINPDPHAYKWQPECFYRDGTDVAYQNGIYRCQGTHTAGLTFDANKWVFQKIFHTALGNPARASFFLTDRGYQAAEHAMERAKAILAKQARVIDISFDASWEVVQDITTDTSLVLSDPRLPDGKIRGKVVKYSLIAKGETGERFGRVTILCPPKGREGDHAPALQVPPRGDDYWEGAYLASENTLCRTPSGLTYWRYDDKTPPQARRMGPLLKGIELINGPEDQESDMGACANGSPRALQKALSSKPTRLRLHFKDLRTKETLEHLIPVTMAVPWCVPRSE